MKPNQSSNSTSLVWYLNFLLAIAVVLLGVVYQFFIKPDIDASEGDGSSLNSKTDDIYDDIPPFPLFTAEELATYDGERKLNHVIQLRILSIILQPILLSATCREATTVLSNHG